MNWIKVTDESIKIPFTQVCIWDGGNVFFAYLLKIEISANQRKLIWHIDTPTGYGECEPLFWMKIITPDQMTAE